MDSEGNVVAVVQADENFNAFIAAAKAALLRNIIISVLVLSLVGFGLFMLIQLWVKMGMKCQVEKAKEELQHINDHLEETVMQRTQELEIPKNWQNDARCQGGILGQYELRSEHL